MENPPKQFFRLSPGREVRLRYAYFIKCVDVVKDSKSGEIVELRCTYDPATRGGDSPPDGRKVKATLHWVSASDAIDAEVRLYEKLLNKADPSDEEGSTFKDFIDPNSLEVIEAAKLEPSLAQAATGSRYQFERLGYFCVDPDSTPGKIVFNRTVTLRDTWARMMKAEAAKQS